MDLLINKLPAPTWNRLHMNSLTIENIEIKQGSCMPEIICTGGCSIVPMADDAAVESRCGDAPTGMGADIDKLMPQPTLRLLAEGKGTAVINMEYADGASCGDKIEIEAAPDSELTVIMTCASEAEAVGLSCVQTKIYVDERAYVKMIQTQLLGKGFTHLNDVGAVVADEGEFDLLQLELGAGNIYDGVLAGLHGQQSDFSLKTGYYGRARQNIDMNFVANHHGKKTTSNIVVEGVLRDGASKLFRGTIDFKNGCSGAVGAEQETVLMLTDDVINRGIPLILCGEEDVQGNHGESIGKLDENILFYLMSRGFSEEAATKMMARAKLDTLINTIEDEKTVSRINEYLEAEL